MQFLIQISKFFLCFFLQAKQLIETIVEPTIQHPSLVNIETIGNWILHSCRHCKVISHAQSANSVKILINPLLWVSCVPFITNKSNES